MIKKQDYICSSWEAPAGIKFFFFFFEDRGLCLNSEWDARSQTTAFFPVSFLVATAFQGGLCFCHSFLIRRVLGIRNTCNWRNRLENFLPCFMSSLAMVSSKLFLEENYTAVCFEASYIFCESVLFLIIILLIDAFEWSVMAIVCQVWVSTWPWLSLIHHKSPITSILSSTFQREEDSDLQRLRIYASYNS